MIPNDQAVQARRNSPNVLSSLSTRFNNIKHHTRSTKHSRNTMRATMVLQLAMSMVVKYSYFALIPFLLSQSVLSSISTVSKNIKTPERISHGSQAFLSWLQLSLIIAMYFTNEDCATRSCDSQQQACTIYEDTQFLCKLYTFMEMIVQGVVLLGFVPGELNKEPSSTDVSGSIRSQTSSSSNNSPPRIASSRSLNLNNVTAPPKN
jgi:hypothetical protein